MTTYPELFAACAARAPHSPALESESCTWSYNELAAAVLGTANRLNRAGVRRGDHVAVVSTPGPAGIVGLLAVMASGAAFVALDPRDPAARLHHVSKIAHVSFSLLGDGAESFVPLGPASRVHPPSSVPPDAAPTDQGTAALTQEAPDPTDLAIVGFTSGSTGLPRGVLIEHRQLVNYVRWAATAHRVDDRSISTPALTRLSFDASVQQVLAPLARGDSVWLVDPDIARHPEQVLAILHARPGAGLHCVPSLWRLILPLVDPEGPPELAALFLGGEVVDNDLWAATRAALPSTYLANVYGPTETTVQASGGFQQPGEPLHAGRAVTGVRFEIVDDEDRPVELGRVGQILIGGAGVARGYLDDPRATAAAFRVRTDRSGTSERWYYSGDLGRMDSRGRLFVTGRRDRQVKIRGHRVELAEVERLLREAGARAAAAVLLHDGELGAVTVAGSGDVRRLRSSLATIAPSVMIPARLETVDRIPALFNGKPDLAAVTAILASRPVTRYDEATLEYHWCRLLGAPDVNSDDDFFALGGHSLSATRLTAAARTVTSRNVPVQAIFDHSTFGAWRAAVAGSPKTVNRADKGRRSSHERVAVTPQQLAMWPIEKALHGTPIHTLALPLWLVERPSRTRLRRLAEFLQVRHDALRAVVVEDRAGVWLRDEGPGEVEVQVHLADSESDILVRAARLTRNPVSPIDGPALQIHMLTHGERNLLLVLTSHLMADGRSLEVITFEIAQLLSGAQSVTPGVSYLEHAQDQAAGSSAKDIRRAEETVAAKIASASPTARLSSRLGRPNHRLASWASPVIPSGVFVDTTPFVHLTAAVAAAAALPGEITLLGTTIENRGAAHQDTVGLFATSAYLAVPVHEDPLLALQAARREVIDVLNIPQVPPELLQLTADVGPARPIAALAQRPRSKDLPEAIRSVDRQEYAHLIPPITPTTVPWFVTLCDDTAGRVLEVEYDTGAVEGRHAAVCGQRILAAWQRLYKSTAPHGRA